MVANPAPLVEMKYARSIMRFERIKLTLLIVVVMLNLAIGAVLLGNASRNHQLLVSSNKSLIILQCAVDPHTSTRPDGTRRTDDEQRTAFQACVKAGGPKEK